MRTIDIQTWSRRVYFNLYAAMDNPCFSMTANVEISAFYPAVKARRASFSLAVVYAITRAANAVPEFRYRIREQSVVEHEVVHPSTTILVPGDLFSFCHFEHREDFAAFAQAAVEEMAFMQTHPSIENTPGRDDRLYMTAIPWVSFTSFSHPIHLHPADSVPRFAWGKYFEEGGRLKMPLNVLAHHALMDGYHMGRFYTLIQEYLDQPEALLEGRKIDNE